MQDANLPAENQAAEVPSASPHCSLTKEEWADSIRSDLAAGAVRIPLSRAARGRFSGDVSAPVFGRDSNAAGMVLTVSTTGSKVEISYSSVPIGTAVRRHLGTDEVAKIVTADHRVLSVNDALFKNMPGQAWRLRRVLKGEPHG